MKRALIWLALGFAALITVLLVQFRRDIRAAQMRLDAAGATIADTACGPIEYLAQGDGPPVISVHGIFGGFDQGILAAASNIGAGFTIIAPSRFGYLGTPMPDGASPEAQADAFICLMDALAVDRAAFFATSAGATSVLQAALRHPDRVAGLVLLSPNAPGEVEVGPMPRAVATVIFRSNFIFWMLGEYAGGAMGGIMGVPAGFDLTPELQAEVAGVMETVLPVRPRTDGALFDMYVSNPAINAGYALDRIDMPVLVIGARDDPLALYDNSYAMARQIPEAQMLGIADGGHMLLGHQDEVRSGIRAFLEALEPATGRSP